MKSIKVALVQFESKIGDMQHNAEKAARFIVDAGKEDADLIVFPELFLTGYDLKVLNGMIEVYTVSVSSPIVQTLINAARQANINCVLPMMVKQSEKLLNGALVVSRDGKVIDVYGKLHLWDEEKTIFNAGNQIGLVKFDFATIGLMICYDAGFPELSRALVNNGAELLVVPAAFDESFNKRWNIYFTTRALENTRYCIAVNGVGHTSGGSYLFGNNKVISPNGDILMDAPLNIEDMQICEIDLSVNKKYEQEIPYLSDLRKDILL